MSTLHTLARFAPLLALLCWAAIIDFRERRIPNWLNLLLILSGIGQSLMPGSVLTLWQSMLGLAAAAVVPFLLFALGALGAGDVKLMAGVGAWLGPVPAVVVLIVEKVIGLTIVIAQAASQRRMRVLFRNSAVLAVNFLHVQDIGLEQTARTGRACRSVERPLPFAVPVLIAVVLVVVRVGGST
jgi:prepilin peptidase CpaA